MDLKPINIFEVILALVAVISHFLMQDHIPFMGLISVLSITTLCMLYFYGGFYILRSPGINTINLIIYGLAFGAATIGILFFMQNWPYAKVELGFGIEIFMILAVIRIIAAYGFKNTNVLQFNKGIMVRYILLLIVMLIAFLSH